MIQRAIFLSQLSPLFLIFFTPILNSGDTKFLLGLENIPDEFIQKIKGARIALITNQTGKDQHGRRNIDILREKGLNIKAILVPEHGFVGNIAAEQEVPNAIDAKTGIPVISLYKQNIGKTITKEMIQDFDILIFDIQDSGTRHYTFISTMFDTLKAAAQFNKQYIILDRPNPLGHLMEGPLVDVTLQSFISIAPIPLRHAMTVGELGWFFNKHLLQKPAKLHVIQMKEYNRSIGMRNLLFTILSPNIASLQSCYGYCFLGMLTAVYPVDVGLKTEKAFQIILLPERVSPSQAQWKKLQTLLQKHGINSSPYKRYHSANKENYIGLQIKIENINNVHSFNLALDIIEFFKKSGLSLTFVKPFDKLTGTKTVRLYLQGSINRKKLADKTNANLNEFLAKVKPSLMYNPAPEPVFIR